MDRAEVPPAAAIGGLQGAHVLLVDDCVDALVPLALLLELSGADVVTADNGADALAHLRAERFDVLVSDLRMPGMTGVDLIRALRADANAEQPVAIAYTGFSSMATREVVEAGFDAVLSKPLGIEKLERTIRSLREDHRRS